MNLLCSYEMYLLLGSLLASWAMSAFFEGLVWHQILKRRLRNIRAFTVLGYMSFIQVISTPLSFGIAILFFGLFISPVLSLSLTVLLHLGLNLAYNPWGVFIGFFIIPIFIEFWFWRSGTKWFLKLPGKTTNDLGPLNHWQYIGASTVIANSCTFLLGMLTSFSIFIGTMFLYLTSIIFLLMIGIFLWFLFSTFQQRDWRNQHPPHYRIQSLQGGTTP
ncbi:MAG: hypothetical protein ACFFDJ_02555 [Candidatus Odinarchaeota archaeon]